MPQLTPLSTAQDAQSGWKSFDNYRFAATDAAVPVALAEITSAFPHFPLVFARMPAGGYRLALLMGLRTGENLYMDGSGRWLAPYVPSHYRAYPFAFYRHEERGELMLCFDRDSGLYRETPDAEKGELRFFDSEGKLQPFLQKIVHFMQQRQQNLDLTQKAVDALEAAEVLAPWPLPAPEEGEEPLKGFYRIDEAKLNSLDGDALLTLREANALPIAYAQLLSMPRLANLKRLYKRRKLRRQQAEQQLQNLDGLFGEGGADEMAFDWEKL